MASVVINGDTSGGITLSAPAVAGSNTQTLVAATGNITPLISGTAVTASGTSVDFTGIPSWAKRITVLFSGVSTSGVDDILVQIGTSSGVVSTGYSGAHTAFAASAVSSASVTTGLKFYSVNAATDVASGTVTIANVSGNTWVMSGVAGSTNNRGTTSGASITLGGVLDRVRITTDAGTDTFDAGTINIMYEG